jgi:hypothetical protein
MKTRLIPTLLLLAVLFRPHQAHAQASPFALQLVPVTVAGLPGIQSYAFGRWDGKWLIVGGRLDGLHRPGGMGMNTPFPVSGNNNQLVVVDPAAGQYWASPLTGLSTDLQAQLSATNAQFYQAGDMLYLAGGYGYDAPTAKHKTFDKLSAVHVPGVIQAVIAGGSLAPHIRQYSDPAFQVTGGQLEKISDTYYLVGGHNFDGTYHHMAGMGNFTQTYTYAIRKFKLADNGSSITITHLPAIVDSAHLRRRDYNLVPQVMPGGAAGITMFSGVFQPQADLPYLDCIDIDSGGWAVQPGFAQYYNHYQCAFLPAYSAQSDEMHTVFFGGMAQYFDQGGVLTQDDNVPFVKTIARVTRHSNGTMDETKLPIDMPSLLGAGSALIPVEGLPTTVHHVLLLDQLTADTTLVGHIFGGISSPSPNVFLSGMGANGTIATSQLFQVYLIRSTATAMDPAQPQHHSQLQMQILPNPSQGNPAIRFTMAVPGDAQVELLDPQGRVVDAQQLKALPQGAHTHTFKAGASLAAGTYLIRLSTVSETVTQRVVIHP